MRPLIVIGWKERIDLPEWGITGMTAKMDTGALGAALDVTRVQRLENGRVRFDVILDRGKAARFHTVEAELTGEARVRSSNGTLQHRLRVRTEIRLGEVLLMTEFSLVSRKRMIHRVLLGRVFLSDRFLIDSGRRFVLGKPPSKRQSKASS